MIRLLLVSAVRGVLCVYFFIRRLLWGLFLYFPFRGAPGKRGGATYQKFAGDSPLVENLYPEELNFFFRIVRCLYFHLGIICGGWPCNCPRKHFAKDSPLLESCLFFLCLFSMPFCCLQQVFCPLFILCSMSRPRYMRWVICCLGGGGAVVA